MLPTPLIKFGFYLLYHHFAWSYDWVAWVVFFGQWADWRRTALPHLDPQAGPTLELAYGTGHLFTELSERGYQPVGIELSPYMVRLAGQRVRQARLPLTLTQAQAQKLPFVDQQFGNVVATFPTNYIFQAETLREIRRVLKPNGRLVVVLHGELRGFTPLKIGLEWLYRITGQRRVDNHHGPIVSQFAKHQFATTWHAAEYNGAVAGLVVATKR